MTRFQRWIARLTGGRPMKREGFAFVDLISGKSVCYYSDAFGRRWLAKGPWSLFRVQTVGGTNDPR